MVVSHTQQVREEFGVSMVFLPSMSGWSNHQPRMPAGLCNAADLLLLMTNCIVFAVFFFLQNLTFDPSRTPDNALCVSSFSLYGIISEKTTMKT